MRALILILIIFPTPLWAWNAPAHRVVAQIAYDQLTPETKEKILKEKNFLASSTWLDQIRKNGITTFDRWHFNGSHADNIVWAIEKSKERMKDNKIFFLRSVVHLVADIHQPLHCMERDRGGNFFPIKNARAKNLHQAWDGALGLSGKRSIKRWARDLETRYPVSRYQSQIKNQQAAMWAQESFMIAKDFAYNTPRGRALSQEYIKQGQKISEERLVLAGYRLGEMLNATLGQESK